MGGSEMEPKLRRKIIKAIRNDIMTKTQGPYISVYFDKRSDGGVFARFAVARKQQLKPGELMAEYDKCCYGDYILEKGKHGGMLYGIGLDRDGIRTDVSPKTLVKVILDAIVTTFPTGKDVEKDELWKIKKLQQEIKRIVSSPECGSSLYIYIYREADRCVVNFENSKEQSLGDIELLSYGQYGTYVIAGKKKNEIKGDKQVFTRKPCIYHPSVIDIDDVTYMQVIGLLIGDIIDLILNVVANTAYEIKNYIHLAMIGPFPS
jgi:hypothetical protein